MNMLKRVKRVIYNIIKDDWDRNIANRLFRYVIITFIIINAIMVAIDVMRGFPVRTGTLSFYIEAATVAVFTVEYILRLWTADIAYPHLKPFKARIVYARSFMAVIDLAAVLPFYLPYAFPVNFMVLRLLRLLRLLRILKVNRYTDTKISEIVLSAMKESVIVTDAELNFISANKSAESLFPSVLNIKKYTPANQIENWPGVLMSINEQKAGSLIQFQMNDDSFYTSNISPVTAKGKILRYIIIIRDVTETVLLERAEKERINTELAIAAKIQASMLPSVFTSFPGYSGFDIYALADSAKEVGGDFYDFFMIDENKLAVVIADVSGKGVPAALFMVTAKILLKNTARQSKNNLKYIIQTVNNLLCENNDECMFVTVFMGILDINSGCFSYINAGHNVPLVKCGGINGKFGWLATNPGYMLAFAENYEYIQDEIMLKKDDVLFLYTDGITEAENPEKLLFTEERLIAVINECKYHTAKDLLIYMQNEIKSFVNGAEQSDDITMLALKIN